MSEGEKRHAPATARNREPIAAVLGEELPEILEPDEDERRKHDPTRRVVRQVIRVHVRRLSPSRRDDARSLQCVQSFRATRPTMRET